MMMKRHSDTERPGIYAISIIIMVYRSVGAYFCPLPRSLILGAVPSPKIRPIRAALPCSRGVCMPKSIALEISTFDSISSSG